MEDVDRSDTYEVKICRPCRELGGAELGHQDSSKYKLAELHSRYCSGVMCSPKFQAPVQCFHFAAELTVVGQSNRSTMIELGIRCSASLPGRYSVLQACAFRVIQWVPSQEDAYAIVVKGGPRTSLHFDILRQPGSLQLSSQSNT